MTKSELKEIIKECLYENDIIRSDSIDITPEEIYEFCGDFNIDDTVLDESTAIDNFKKLGLNSTKLNSSISKSAKNICRVIKSEGINEESKKHIYEIIIDLFDEIAAILEITDIPGLNFKNYDANKIKNAYVLVVMNIIINSLSDKVFGIIFGPIAGVVITVSIIGPMNEEIAKYISIKGGYAKEYYIIFNAVEFTNYVSVLHKSGEKLSRAIFARSRGVLAHLANTIVQWIFNNPKLQKKLGLDPENDKDRKKASFIGLLTTTLLHASWNSSATINALIKMAKILG